MRLKFITETFFALLTKKAKASASRDRIRYWTTEAEALEAMAAAGRTRDLYAQTRRYAGKCRPAGILFLKDQKGNPLESPEDRMSEWTREFKHRYNPQVPVQYDCTAEDSDDEWQDNTRDDDATSTLPEERLRQKQIAHSQLLPGHSTLLVTPSRKEVTKGLMSSKLRRSPGLDGITAELIRAALPWLVTLMILIWKWKIGRAHV